MTAHAGSAHVAERSGPGLVTRLSLHQFRYDLRAFFRNRQARFFTLVLPVLFLVIFASLFHGQTVDWRRSNRDDTGQAAHHAAGSVTGDRVVPCSWRKTPQPGPMPLADDRGWRKWLRTITAGGRLRWSPAPPSRRAYSRG